MVLNISNNNNLNTNQLDEINRLGLEIVKDYNEVIDNYSIKFKSDHYFWSTEIPSRNSNDNDIFKNIVFTTYAINQVTLNKKIKKVLVSNVSVYKVLKNHLNKSHVKVVLERNILKHIKILIYPFIKYFFNFFLISKSFIFSHLTYVMSKKKRLHNNSILIDTFIIKSSIKENSFVDIYYKNFLGLFKRHQNQKFYYIPSFVGIDNYYKTYMALRKSNQNFLFKEDYLMLNDYISALLLPIKSYRFKPKDIIIRGINFTPLFKDNWYRNLSSLSSINALLNYFFIKRLNKHQIKIKSFVNWFENQSCDKCYNLALSKFYPNVFRSGYLVSFDSKFYTSLYPTDNEKSNNLIPNKIFTSSSLFAESIKEYCKDLSTHTITSFRNQYIWDLRKVQNQKKDFSILVSLTGVEVFRNDVLNLISEIDSIKFKIKLHPADNLKTVKKSFNKKWPKNFSLVEDSFSNLICNADLLISSNSTTILDSISIGVPVIIIGGKSNLTQNPIPEKISKSLYRIVYSIEELEKSLIYFRDKFDSNSDKNIIEFEKTKLKLNTKSNINDFKNLLNIN